MDRNLKALPLPRWHPRSLSARRAWIEIVMPFLAIFWVQVALRKESVDRNRVSTMTIIICIASLSARRAWIEITVVATLATLVTAVALRKESVDRNLCRNYSIAQALRSLSARRAWIEIVMPFFGNFRVQSRSPQGERG